MPKSQRGNTRSRARAPAPKKAGSRPAIAARIAKPKPTAGRFRSLLFPGHSSTEHACAKHYTKTVLDPFDTEAGACVPMLPCLDSAKRRVFARGTGMTQNNGFGGVVAATSCSHDAPAVWYTAGGGTGDTMNATTNVAAYSNSELNNADFTSGDVQARIVGCGVRVRYIGRPIDCNGRTFSLEEPSHLNVSDFTVAKCLKLDRVKSKPLSREWTVACWQPVRPGEHSYHANANAATDPTHYQPLCVLIQAQGELPLPFEWEWFCHYEAIGSGARGKSESHVAPIAGPKAIAALQKTPTDVFDDVSNKRLSSNRLADNMISQGSSFDWSKLADTGMRVAQTAIGAVTSRAAAQYMSGGLAALAV